MHQLGSRYLNKRYEENSVIKHTVKAQKDIIKRENGNKLEQNDGHI